MKFFNSNWSQATDLKLSLFTTVMIVPSEQQNTQDNYYFKISLYLVKLLTVYLKGVIIDLKC